MEVRPRPSWEVEQIRPPGAVPILLESQLERKMILFPASSRGSLNTRSLVLGDTPSNEKSTTLPGHFDR